MKLRMALMTVLLLWLPSTLNTQSPEPVPRNQASDSAALNGMELLRWCNAAGKMANGSDLDAAESIQALRCFGYLSGFVDGYVLGTSLSGKGYKHTFCPPEDGVENEQAVRIVTKWLKENPEHLHQSGRLSALIALSRAFPCE